MTQTEKINQALEGKRVESKFSLFKEEKTPNDCGYNHWWRTIVCNGETDVVECANCGKQEVTSCNFDDEYA